MKYNANIVSLFGLYCAQGTPLGFALFALPGILRAQGADLRFIGLVGLSMLPWAFKFIWASWLENRRPWGFSSLPAGLAWIQLLKLLSLAAIATLFWFDPAGHIIGLVVMVTAVNLFYATQDVAVDALAVRTFAGSRHVNVNVGQVAGFSLGMLVGGVVSLYVFYRTGWQGTVLLCLLIQVVCHLPFQFHLGHFARQPAEAEPVAEKGASLRYIFRRKHWGPVILTALLFKSASTLGASLVSPLLVDMGVSLDEIALMSGSVLIVSYIAGAVASGVLHRWLSSAQLTLIGLSGSLLCWLGMAASLTVDRASSQWVFTFFVLEGFFFNLCCVALFAWFMCWSEGEKDGSVVQPGTDFTLLQCCEVLGSSTAMVIGGTLAHYLGFANTFYVAALFGAVIALVIMRCFRRVPDRTREEPQPLNEVAQ